MNQKIYTGHVRSHYVPKNKLLSDISDYIDTLDGKAFTQEQFMRKRVEIGVKINELNDQHNRARNVHPDWHRIQEPTGKEQHFLHGVQSIDFVFISGEIDCITKM
jgi:hypothetical protein